MKTFPIEVISPDGSRSMQPATQLATFAHYIKNIQFRFVVTEMPGCLPVVTHRVTGCKVCDVPLSSLAAARQDAKQAGILALSALVQNKGPDRVYDVLRRAEMQHA